MSDVQNSMTATPKRQRLQSCGMAIDVEEGTIGILRDSSDASEDFEELRRRFEEDGYLYMPGYLERDSVLAARKEIVSHLADANLLDPEFAPIEGVCPVNARTIFAPHIAQRSVAVQELLYHGRLMAFYRQFFDEPVRHYDFTWLRAIPPGKGTSPHSDLPYMGRGTHGHMTCWMPYGDISFELGGLMILENSHRRLDLLGNYVYRDVDSFCENIPGQRERAEQGTWIFDGTLSNNPCAIRDTFGGRWLTAEFRAGDFLTFGMFLVHASLDNTTSNRLRISSDSRYQRASEPIDERWVGAEPIGHSRAAKRGRIC